MAQFEAWSETATDANWRATDMIEDLAKLAGKRAIVTGAGSGIGKAVSLALASLGMQVTLVGRDEAKLRRAAAEAASGRCAVWPMDLADPYAIELFSKQWADSHAELRVLVHCAALYKHGTVEDTTAHDVDAVLSTNLRAPFLLTARLLDALRRGRGDVVFLNSSAAIRPGSEVSAYAMSKAGLRCLADALRHEVNRDHVRVLSVFAGRTATPMLEQVLRAEGSTFDPADYLRPQDVAQAVVSAISMGSSAELTELHVRPAQPARVEPRGRRE
jgi:NAD(P)-dependent dehydrogenase (short-subunit alcohol dehydrogenase family)